MKQFLVQQDTTTGMVQIWQLSASEFVDTSNLQFVIVSNEQVGDATVKLVNNLGAKP